MRWIWILLLLPFVGGWGNSGGGLTCPKGYVGGGLTPCTPAYAFFEFAPASGAGMGAACACTTPTGAKGETLTFTRASTGTCLKGNTTTSINNGDLVSCASGQPRVMPGGDGTGGLGLLVESSRTNVVLQSEALNNASWTTSGIGAAAPSVTADQTTSPASTLTADLVSFSATTAGQQSLLLQTVLSTAVSSGSVFALAQSSSCTFDICIETSVTPTYTCTSCTAPAGSQWARCKLENISAAGGQFLIGNATSINGGTTRAACATYIWGTQGETGAYATSYIPTTTVAVTRAVENASVNGSGFPAGTYSKAVTIVVPWATATQPSLPSLLMGEVGAGFHGSDLFIASGGLRTQNGSGSAFVNTTSGALTITANSPLRLATASGSGSVSMYVAGALFSGPTAVADSTAPNATILGIADNSFGVSPLDGVIKQICWDASLSRCR